MGEPLNPYDPPKTENLVAVGIEVPVGPSKKVIRTIAFMIGCSVGLHYGWLIQHGLGTTLERLIEEPLLNGISKLVFSLVCLICSVPYRFLRSNIHGRFHARSIERFLSGFIMVAVGYTINVALERLSLISKTTPQGAEDWILVVFITLISVVISVEFEARRSAKAGLSS